MFRLDGRVALVTGGSRGIGRACAEALAGQGATVLVNYVKGEAAAREVADGIASKGGKAEVTGFDVADSKAVDAAVEQLVKKHGKIDVLGAIACARACSRPMMRARWGRIVFMSSVVAEMGNVGQTAYAATKAALIGAAKSIAREFASRNITVNVVAPGFIDTEMTAGMNDAMK